MGRYLTPSAAAGSSSLRSQRNVLTASNPALAVPAWAKAMRVSGCGGGGGGSVAFGGTGGVDGGACAGIAHDAIMPLIGVATISVVIGTAGIGKAAGSSGSGTAGGNTVITAGANVITLEGANGPLRGRAYMGTVVPVTGYSDYASAAGLMAGYADTGSVNGSSSPFGGAGIGRTDALSAEGDAGNATGYGAGGGGSHSGKGGNGSPGLAIIEFLEAA